MVNTVTESERPRVKETSRAWSSTFGERLQRALERIRKTSRHSSDEKFATAKVKGVGQEEVAIQKATGVNRRVEDQDGTSSERFVKNCFVPLFTRKDRPATLEGREQRRQESVTRPVRVYTIEGMSQIRRSMPQEDVGNLSIGTWPPGGNWHPLSTRQNARERDKATQLHLWPSFPCKETDPTHIDPHTSTHTYTHTSTHRHMHAAEGSHSARRGSLAENLDSLGKSASGSFDRSSDRNLMSTIAASKSSSRFPGARPSLHFPSYQSPSDGRRQEEQVREALFRVKDFANLADTRGDDGSSGTSDLDADRLEWRGSTPGQVGRAIRALTLSSNVPPTPQPHIREDETSSGKDLRENVARSLNLVIEEKGNRHISTTCEDFRGAFLALIRRAFSLGVPPDAWVAGRLKDKSVRPPQQPRLRGRGLANGHELRAVLFPEEFAAPIGSRLRLTRRRLVTALTHSPCSRTEEEKLFKLFQLHVLNEKLPCCANDANQAVCSISRGGSNGGLAAWIEFRLLQNRDYTQQPYTQQPQEIGEILENGVICESEVIDKPSEHLSSTFERVLASKTFPTALVKGDSEKVTADLHRLLHGLILNGGRGFADLIALCQVCPLLPQVLVEPFPAIFSALAPP